MLRVCWVVTVLALPAEAAALEIEMAVPSGLEIKLDGVEMRGAYMEASVRASAPVVDIASAYISCKAKNRDGYTWSLDGVMNNLAKGEIMPLTLISLATMEDYELASPVVGLRCYPESMKYGYLDLFP